jgi:trans-2,3-dihydro-3-hydroxyanthranilate isomerase
MKQIEPIFGSNYKAKDIAEIIGVREEEIDVRYPIQEVSTGINFLLVPLRNLNANKKARVDLTKYKAFFKENIELPIFIYSKETYEQENDFNCRMLPIPWGYLKIQLQEVLMVFLRHTYQNMKSLDQKI